MQSRRRMGHREAGDVASAQQLGVPLQLHKRTGGAWPDHAAEDAAVSPPAGPAPSPPIRTTRKEHSPGASIAPRPSPLVSPASLCVMGLHVSHAPYSTS